MQRILILRSGALGDFLLTLPAIRALREGNPGVTVEIAGRLSILALAHLRGYAEEVRSIDGAEFAPLFAQDGVPSPEFAAHLRGADLILSYVPDRDGLLRANLGRIGVARVASGDPIPGSGESRHMAERLADPVRELGIPVPDLQPRVYPNGADRADAASFLRGNGIPGSFLAVHPGSGGRRKCWPPGRFGRVADEVARRIGARVVVTSGPADGEIAEAMAGSMGAPPILARDLPLPVLAAMLSRCRVYLGNDSGVTHLAAAAGTPVVALFGPTDPAIWAPRGDRVKVVRGDPALPADRRLEAIVEDEVIRAAVEAAG